VRIAIVHDDLTQRGGAERVVEAMHSIWPSAPIYTSVYDAKNTFSTFTKCEVCTSYMQKIPFAASAKYNKFFLIFYPTAFEMLDLRGFDVVISSTTRFAHGVITSPETCHISYCHSPSRFAWRYHEYISEGKIGKIFERIIPLLVHHIRVWDFIASKRVDYYIANSKNTARRLLKFYGVNSRVVYPPVETHRFFIEKNPTLDYYLIVSRLVSYKKIDLAIQACNQLSIPLKVVGNGPDLKRLRSIAGSTVEVLGRVPDGEVEKLFANCKGFFFPGEEDFGIAPLEAMASGRPVIAYRAGGAIETVVDGETGVFFDEPTVESLVNAIKRFEQLVFDPIKLRLHAEKFSVEVFQKQISILLENFFLEHNYKYKNIT
jgi:glycosyltransferase involved in cell wall biosynthesis